MGLGVVFSVPGVFVLVMYLYGQGCTYAHFLVYVRVLCCNTFEFL
jgi:hypothetical protein